MAHAYLDEPNDRLLPPLPRAKVDRRTAFHHEPVLWIVRVRRGESSSVGCRRHSRPRLVRAFREHLLAVRQQSEREQARKQAPASTATHRSLHRTGTTTTSACSPSILRECDGIDGVVATRVHSHVVRGGGRLIPRWARWLGATAVTWYAPGPGVPHAACDILRIDLDRKAAVHPMSECQLSVGE